jgi:polysaccharide biosynthesis protein PslG
MSARRQILSATLMGFVIVTAGLWVLLPRRTLHYAMHTLSADAHSLALARQAHFDTVVQLFSWRQIEPTRGEYYWQYPDEVVRGAEYYGLGLVVRLDQHPQWASQVTTALNAPPDDLADYARFVSAVALRYRGRVKAYIIWNEPNLAQEWGGRRPDPAGYVSLLHAAYQAVKAADPNALVISAGLAPTNTQDETAMDDRAFLEALYLAGGKADFDVLGVHPYGFAYSPYDPHGAHEGLNTARLEDLRALMVKYGDGEKPVWATELGWTVEAQGQDAWQEVSPEQQADYVVGALQRARREWPWLQLVAIWNLDGALQSSPWSGYSLLDATGQPRPAYAALQALDKGWDTPQPEDAPAAIREFWEERWGRPRYQVLAPDTVIHLGDGDFSAPWVSLFGARNPSTVWQGTVYVPYPGSEPWRLTLRVMQSNVWSNYVWVNGQRLEPTLPPEDFSGSWVSCTWEVPAGWVQPGPNQIAVSIGRSLPLLQEVGSAWDDLQIKDVVVAPDR